MLYKDPCTYWNKDVFTQTYTQLESLFKSHGNLLEIDESIFNYFLMGYNSYCQISDIIMDLRNFNLMQETKTQLYRLPTYTTLLESCLSNFLRVIATLTGRCIGKDYSSQNTLGQLTSIMATNGYSELSNGVNVNIRNAINHGKVLLKKVPGDRICFYYSENHVQKCQEMSLYDFDRVIDDTYDLVSAVFLSIVVFINGHISLLKIDGSKKSYEAFAYLAMLLSMPGVLCQNVSDALYINVYRYDTRQSKELMPNNDNFVCFVDWNLSGNTTLKNGGLPQVIWQQLSHEQIGKMSIAWREKHYRIRKIQKPSRNDPCPCGSGKKFKKCCYSKGIYD